MKFTKFVLSVCLLILSSAVFSYSQTGEKVVVGFIAGQAAEANAVEYAGARKILRGDLNGDGKADLVVLYTLEGFDGSNMYLQYLAVFLQKGKSYAYRTHTLIGGKNRRAVDLKAVRSGKINLETLRYLPNDASCCPSLKGRASLVLRGGKLKEI